MYADNAPNMVTMAVTVAATKEIVLPGMAGAASIAVGADPLG